MKKKSKGNTEKRIERNCKQCKGSGGGASNSDLAKGHTTLGKATVIESPRMISGKKKKGEEGY